MEVAELNQMAQRVAELKNQKEKAEEVAKKIGEELTSIEQKLCEALVQEGHEKWLLPGLGTLSVSVKTYWNVKDPTVALKYFQENAPEQIKVNGNSIRGWANEFREQNPMWNPEAAGIAPYDKVGITFRRSK